MAAADGLGSERLLDIGGGPAWRRRCSQAARWRPAFAAVCAALLVASPLVVFRLGQRASAPSSAATTGTLQRSESALLRGELLCKQAHNERECDRIGCCTFNKQSSACESAVGNSPCHQGSSVEVGVEWVLSAEGANCKDTCDGKGLQCNQEALTSVETEGQVIDIAHKAGHKCRKTATWSYETNPGVCTSDDCCGGDCKGICVYGAPGPGQLCGESLAHYSRLCPCSKKGARWVLAAEASSCTEACKKEGAACDEKALKKVNTADEVMGVARAAGRECASHIGATVGWAYDSNPGICTNSQCCGDGSCTGVCAFGQTGSADCFAEGGHYSRFCPCTGGAPDGPAPTPAPPPKEEAEVERLPLPSWHWMSGIEGMDSSAGFSWYTRIFTLLQEPPMDWQMGTAGSWMTPTNIDFDVCACDPKGWPSSNVGDPSYGCCESASKCSWLYSTIEGGPGYWSGSQLPTRTMKWRIVVTTACYEKGGQTPLFFYGGKVLGCDDMGVVQLSNRMLLAPDGIAFSQQGLFGVGFVRTPVGKVSEDDNRNFWTLVVDAENFAGPVAYLLPELFRERPAKWRVQSAHLKDFGTPGTGISNGGGFGFEWNTLFSFRQGDFIKIPQMAVPLSHGKSVLAMNGRGYKDEEIYHPLEEALSKHDGQLRTADVMAHGTPFRCNAMEADANFRISEADTVSLGKLRTEKGADGCVWSLSTDNSSGFFPHYFRASDLKPVDESAVPHDLKAQAFPKKGSIWPTNTPYDALGAPPSGGCLASPGPADDALYCAQTSSPSWVAYRWYQFVDQPGLQRLGLSKAEKAFLQKRVTRLHRMLHGKDRWMKAGAAADGGLAEVSGAQLVTPPKHLEFGYVPIAVFEGAEKPPGCKA